eukprot:11608190-Alexandrium_andersonii.AAC.1
MAVLAFQQLKGFAIKAQVRAGNMMVARVVCLCYLANVLGLVWLVEQPTNSLLEKHPFFQALMKNTAVYRFSMRMSKYGAESSKPTWLYCNKPYVKTLARFVAGEAPSKTVKKAKL